LRFARQLQRIEHPGVRRKCDRLLESQDRTQQQLDQFSVKVDQIVQDVDIAFQTMLALSANTERTLPSINAASERQDKIIDYLLKRDGNNSSD